MPQETMSAKPKPAPAKTTEAETTQLCRLFNLTSARIGQLAKDGIIFKTGRNKFDLWRSVRGYIEFLQRSKTEGAAHIARSTQVGDPQELEELVRQVKAARTYNDARTLKVQIDALRAGYALEIDQGKHVARAIIEEALMRIGSAVKAAVLRMEADLPPMLEGATPAAMQRMIREKTDEVMTTLSDATSEVWKDVESPETTP
jgi:phage terminase Nu1 subunit (DNA packaging protein)